MVPDKDVSDDELWYLLMQSRPEKGGYSTSWVHDIPHHLGIHMYGCNAKGDVMVPNGCLIEADTCSTPIRCDTKTCVLLCHLANIGINGVHIVCLPS